MKTETVGFTFALLDMVTYGFFPVVAHYFVATIDPLLFGGLATLVGAFPLIFQLKLQNKEKDLYSSSFLKPLLLIAILTTIANFFFFFGTKLTSGINTGLLVQAEPIYSVILSALFLGEAIGIGQLSATLLMILGAVVVVYKGPAGFNLGDMFILITPIFYQLSHLVAKKILNKVSSTSVIPAARLLYGGVLLTVIALILNPSSLNQAFIPQNILAIILFGFIFRALDFSLWYQAIKRIALSKASAVLPLSVAISFFGSILFLKETATSRQYLGLLLIVVGLVWLSLIHLRPKLNKIRS